MAAKPTQKRHRERSPTNNRARTTADTADTTGHSPNTGLRAPALNSQERNPNDQKRNPQRPTAPLAEHSAGPGGSTAAWAWAPCSGPTAKARSGSSSLAAAATVPRPSAVARLLRKQHRRGGITRLARRRWPFAVAGLDRQGRRGDSGLSIIWAPRQAPSPASSTRCLRLPAPSDGSRSGRSAGVRSRAFASVRVSSLGCGHGSALPHPHDRRLAAGVEAPTAARRLQRVWALVACVWHEPTGEGHPRDDLRR